MSLFILLPQPADKFLLGEHLHCFCRFASKGDPHHYRPAGLRGSRVCMRTSWTGATAGFGRSAKGREVWQCSLYSRCAANVGGDRYANMDYVLLSALEGVDVERL